MAGKVGVLTLNGLLLHVLERKLLVSVTHIDQRSQIWKRQTTYRQLCGRHLGRLLLADERQHFFLGYQFLHSTKAFLGGRRRTWRVPIPKVLGYEGFR